MSSTEPSIELQPRGVADSFGADVNVGPTRRTTSVTSSATASLAQRSQTGQEAEDDVLLASRIQDSEVPDGGVGWLVVAGCGMITFWYAGSSYSFGVIQAALVKEGVSTPATLAFVGSLTVACIAAFALVNARIIKILGSQKTAILGVLFQGTGGVLSGFTSKNVSGLFVTSGLIMGIGTSLCFMVVSTTPAQYFSKKRGLANGVVYAAGGLGGTIISFAFDFLVQRLGVAWTFRIIGFATLLTGLPAAWVIKERIPIRTVSWVEWRLFRDLKFTALFLAGAIATFPLFVPPFLLPLYTASLGFSTSTSAAIVASFNLSSAVGRLLVGFLCDKAGALNSLFLSLAFSAFSMLVLWPLSKSMGPLMMFVIINGMSNGAFFSAMPTVVSSVFGSTRVGVAMGMIVTGWVGGYLMGSPIAGYLLEAYGGASGSIASYHPAIWYAGSMAAGAAALVLFVRMRIKAALWARL
ncbi:MFS general substrate transporter [Meredithblackwellia eburnea MCA 4105]